MTNFLNAIETSLPSKIVLPKEFKLLLVWMEENGFVRQDGRTGPYASLYPTNLDGNGTSLILFHPVAPGFVKAWTRSSDPEIGDRLAAFVRTGGDGSYAAIWLDDDGLQKFVHLGSGSGSTMMCTLTDDPVDFLRLLAIGYEELCWPDQYEFPPVEVYEEEHDEDDDPFLPPLRFREWVEATFGRAIPETAEELVPRTVSMDAAASDDPFWLWIKRLQS
jgi:hypothetical protein